MRRLIIGALGVGVMLREQMIGKWSVGETGKQVLFTCTCDSSLCERLNVRVNRVLLLLLL